ncbi:Quinate/shikimate dehydrogenase (NAD(+)) [Pandoraea terrae]|uniref:Shikimate dehydrogenase (NADP(+)) n=1 Tax=Pandoraea terrae TaxID=1537710 RepID=A0A5E4SER5_9BURK|nr:shikimate dehydrogenase [Pandoraea terrae]VVD72964.1 Quinate/shikimate dehydrogenase (NAD(+)) [Pandoraea terrae]
MNHDLRVEPKSFLIGLIGEGIAASLSPAIHEEEARRLGVSYVYRRIDLAELGRDTTALPALVKSLEDAGFDGFNVTYPCKQAIIGLLDELSDDAKALGAVNTVVLRNGRRIGHNTDWSGFYRSFRQGLPADVATERVALIGSGGAGCAVGHAAMKLGTRELRVFDVDADRAQRLADDLQERFPGTRVVRANDIREAMNNVDGVIHATPTGMTKLPGMPIPAELLRSSMWVADVVYFPIETELIRTARAAGCRTLNGGGMAVYQAVDAFQIYTGITPNPDRMLDHFRSLLSS